MDDMIELRCKYCGAPLDRKDAESDSPYVTCPSCGTTQQRVDAKRYMEQLMGQIQSWVSRSLPGGLTIGQTENADPLARRSIFMNSVKPKLDVEINQYRFALNDAISSPLIVLPFSKGEPKRSSITANQAFEFDAKLKTVSPLAVDEDSSSVIREGEGFARTFALIQNNSKLLTEDLPGRFTLMAGNFAEAAESLKGVRGYESLRSRLLALAEVCTASDMVLNGDALGCSAKAESGIASLEKAKQELLANPRLAMTLGAVDQEIAQSRTLKNVADMACTGTTKDPLKLMTVIAQVSAIRYPPNPQWDRLLRRDDRDYELYGYVKDIVAAKNGGTLTVCTGGGTLLYPFWDVDLRYSFTTGSLFSKKSVIVTEDLMVPATFTLSSRALSDPREGLTDIFAAAPESTIMNRLKGEEQSISGGAGIGRLADSASESAPGSRTVVVPVSTRSEATRLVELYLDQCSRTHSKLKLSRPEVKRLVYVPCEAHGGVELPKAFGGLEPAVVRELGTDKLITLRGGRDDRRQVHQLQDDERHFGRRPAAGDRPGDNTLLGDGRPAQRVRRTADSLRRLHGRLQRPQEEDRERLRALGRGRLRRRRHNPRRDRGHLRGLELHRRRAAHGRRADRDRGRHGHRPGRQEQERAIMTIDETVKDEMKGDLSLYERVAMYVPLYRGYREKNLRREQDRAVRNLVATSLQGAKADLATIQRELVDQPDLMMDVERIRTKVDRYDIKVRKAVNGYSGFHDAVKILEDDLDALVRWDAQLVDGIQEFRQAASDLLDAADVGAVAKKDVRQIERGIDEMIEAYDKRDAVMKGFDKGE